MNQRKKNSAKRLERKQFPERLRPVLRAQNIHYEMADRVRAIEERPHQALWDYTPGVVHRLGNNKRLLEHNREMVRIVKGQRKSLNNQPIAVSN